MTKPKKKIRDKNKSKKAPEAQKEVQEPQKEVQEPQKEKQIIKVSPRPRRQETAPEPAKEGAIFKQVIDGQELTFQLEKGELKLLKKKDMRQEKSERKFRLRPMTKGLYKTQKIKRFHCAVGLGKRTIRLWTKVFEHQNLEAKERAELENVVTIIDKEVARNLATRTSLIEEVFD